MLLFHGTTIKKGENILKQKEFSLNCDSVFQALGCGIYFTNTQHEAKVYGSFIIKVNFPELDEWDGEQYNNKYVSLAPIDIGVMDDITLEYDDELQNLASDKDWDELKQNHKIIWRYVPDHALDDLKEFVVFDLSLANKRLQESLLQNITILDSGKWKSKKHMNLYSLFVKLKRNINKMPKELIIKEPEKSKERTLTLYTGQCSSQAYYLRNNGWKGNEEMKLFLTNIPEIALDYADWKGCSSVLKVKNIPLSYLKPDPDDDFNLYSLKNLLEKYERGENVQFILIKSLSKDHFEILPFNYPYKEGYSTKDFD